MAIFSRVRPLKKILPNNIRCSVRIVNSAPTSSIFAGKTEPVCEKPKEALVCEKPEEPILNLDDGRKLFSSVPTAKLVRSLINLQMVSVEPVVDLGTWVMNSRLMDIPLFRRTVNEAVKHTFFDHFCAGEDPEAAGRVAGKLWESGLKGMLDYGLESALDNDACDRNSVGFLHTVESTKSLPQSSVSFVVLKISAICPLPLLKRVSDLLRWEYKEGSSCHLPWKLNCLPIFADSSPFYHTPTRPDPLTGEEETDLELAMGRMNKLCEKCLEANVPLLIDAEDTAVQPAIDYFGYSASIVHNRDDSPVVFGTIQTYLKDAKDRLVRTSVAAEKMGVPMGFKLVRGAYMSSERQLADSLGVESPIHNTIDQTHACYNECASLLLEKFASAPGKVVLATHNIESGKIAAAKARDLGIAKETDKVQFAQLYGMAEVLSYGLRNAGFQVSKYMPFGPVDQIMPYLLRRAEENRGLLSTSAFDRQLMRKELTRRVKASMV